MSTVRKQRNPPLYDTAKLPALEPKALSAAQLFFNRELSLLQFHKRVLGQGLDPSNPLLERLKFLGIFSSNIDEFFMIRVSGLKEEVDENVTELSADGLTPAEQLAAIRRELVPMIREQARCLTEDLLPALGESGIKVMSWKNLSAHEKKQLEEYFTDKVLPVLTPLAVDRSHPFPYISPSSLNIGLVVNSPREPSPADPPKFKFEPRFVRVKVPLVVPRLVPIGGSQTRFVLQEDLIEANIHKLFPGMLPGECHQFRVTRDADIQLREEEASDLLNLIQREVRQRRFGTPVRVEVSTGMPSDMVEYLSNSLGLTEDDVYFVDGPLGIQEFLTLYDLDRPELKDEPFEPASSPWSDRSSIFEEISKRDILVHHPYDSYDCVTDFINSAVEDEGVVAIKMCLYRTGPDSPIPAALIRASEQGKQVTALIELKARFDEEHNIEWAQKLDEAGVHVVYGIVGLKTHGKLTLIVRREEDDSLKRYVHIASGNYNPTTSCTYTDLGLFSADSELGADATEFFNYLTGCSRQINYRQIFVAPVNLRERFNALIDREIEHKKAGRESGIVVKCNRLADQEMIEKLYEASNAGVKIDLIIRGICMLRPGVPGLSENIVVRNVVGRFLEHSRVFHFVNGGNDEVFIGSSDWMSRNLKHRIEVVAPVTNPVLRNYLKDVLLPAYLRDNVKAQLLQPNGEYSPIERDGAQRFNVQDFFIDCITNRTEPLAFSNSLGDHP